MDAVQPCISLILQTTRKSWPRRCARKNIFKSIFEVSSQISVDLHIYTTAIALSIVRTSYYFFVGLYFKCMLSYIS